MDEIIVTLLRIQELVLVRDEHRATSKKSASVDQIDDEIDQLLEGLPIDVKQFYNKLQQRDHTFMAPIHNGHCAVCGSSLPASILQSVRQGKVRQHCPMCARFLFESQTGVKWVAEAPNRRDAPKTGIARFSGPELMVTDLVADSAADAIEILASKMEEAGYISQAGKLITAALAREADLSTAVGHQLAFPHVRGVEGSRLTLACGVSKTPFEYDEAGTPVSIVFLIMIPSAAASFYLRVVSGLCTALSEAAKRKTLITPETPEALWKALCKVTRASIK